ncbi:MAG: aminotransferase class I/II-fold pyridoxal phosphate-dependent enzyme, partial [Carnobacterium sp.]
MKQTNFDQVTDRTGTYCTQWDYIEDRFGEKNLLPFSVSDTDFKVPTAIIDTLKKRMDHEIFGYTRWNHLSFKGAIQQWYQNRFQSTIETDWVLYSPSVIYSVAKLIELKSERGDYIVMQTPAYDAFFKTITDNQRIIHENPLLFNDGHYTIDFIDLEKRLSHPKTKIFLLCSPHNPTGR